MIAILSGVISEKINDLIIIDVHGVGYGVLTPSGDYGKLLTGDSAKFYIYEQIRENSYDLYGFLQLDTKKLFEQLLEVHVRLLGLE